MSVIISKTAVQTGFGQRAHKRVVYLTPEERQAARKNCEGYKMTDKLYFINGGEVTEISEAHCWDGTNTLQVIAESPDDALTLARLYDSGQVQWDNHMINGLAVCAVSWWCNGPNARKNADRMRSKSK